MSNNDYSEHSGWIANGPSRETMFDSLRLGMTVEVSFIFTDKGIRDCPALISSIEKRVPYSQEVDNHDWVIELMFKENHQAKRFSSFWKGYYSTHSRQGQLNSTLPASLIV